MHVQVNALLAGQPVKPPTAADLLQAEKAGHLSTPEPIAPTDLAAADGLATPADAKEAGNAAFKAGEYGRALACYNRTVQLVAEGQGGLAGHEMAMATLGNLAAAWLKARFPGRAEEAATAAVSQAADSDNLAKVLFRRATAREKLQDFAAAAADCTAAITHAERLHPRETADKEVQRLRKDLARLEKKAAKVAKTAAAEAAVR